MSEIVSLEPQPVWKFFDLICSVPHPSGHEKLLAQKLMDTASAAGLTVRQDSAGNIRIDRPAAPGFETVPTVILQGHLDMVPESDHPFDFLSEAVTPRIDGEWVTACGTTLGADNGIGVAHAMALLCDKDLQCGALAGVFTVEEETGMGGAANIANEFLEGKYLLNCDNDSSGEFCIGCAGGARQNFYFTPEWQEASGSGITLTLTGLPGGHSGSCIHLDRGNAIRFMAEFLDMNPEISVAEINAGKVDNAIPATCCATGCSHIPVAELQKLADAFVLLVQQECRNAGNMRIDISSGAMPEAVWSENFRKQIIPALALVPDGVLAFSEKYQVVQDSSNLAVIVSGKDSLRVSTSQRSIYDAERDRICALIREHFVMFGATAESGAVYPATPPHDNPVLLDFALQVRKEMALPAGVRVIHAGLESGWLSMKNPDLEIVSCGPKIADYHTPEEKVFIPAVQEFDRFLRLLLQKIALNG